MSTTNSERILEIEELAQLAPLESQWKELLAATPHGSFFSSLDWLRVYWRHFAHEQQLRVLLHERDGKLLGIWPLVLRREDTWVGRLRVLCQPLDYWGSFYGPIGVQPDDTWRAACRYLASRRPDWELLDLRWVADDARSSLSAALADVGLGADPPLPSPVPLISLDGDWNAYWQSRSPRFRSAVRRCERRLAELGRMRYEHFRPEPLADDLRLAPAVEMTRRQSSRGPRQSDRRQAARDARLAEHFRWDLFGACCQITDLSHHARDSGVSLLNPEAKGYFRNLHESACAAGAVDLHLLYLENQPVAFNYNLRLGGYVSGLRRAFDQRVTDGAGWVLMQRMLETNCRLGDHTVDLGPEYLSAKRPWQTELYPSWRLTHYRRSSPLAQTLRWARRWRGNLSPSFSRTDTADPTHAACLT